MLKLKHVLALTTFFTMLTAISFADGYELSITQEDVRLDVGEQVQFQASLTDEQGNTIDARFSWEVKEGRNVGSIDQTGLFTAEQDGKAEIQVTAIGYDEEEDTHVYVGNAGDGDDHDGDDDHGDHNGDDDGDDDQGEHDDDHDGDHDDDHDGDHSAYQFIIKISPRKVETALNTQVQFFASVYDLQKNPVDTTVTWELSGWPIGVIDESGLFTAQAYGEAHVIARLGQDYGKAKIEVEDEDGDDDHGNGHDDHDKRGYRLMLTPRDTVVYVGDAVQFIAVLKDSNGQPVDAPVRWKIEHNSSIGTITRDGLFTAMQSGLAFIEAKAKGVEAKTSIQVMERAGSDVNSMRVYRILPNGAVIDDSVIIREGEMLKLEDLPFPFEILNGSMLTIPDGALHEDIHLTIDLSELANVQDDSVFHPQNIVNAVEFKVSVAGDTIHPYYFDKPLRISIPFDRELLQKYGIDPDSLDIAYYLGDDFVDRVGIENVVIDTTQNRIFAEIIHFSTLVIYNKQSITTDAQRLNAQLPNEFVVYQNYPNPFNPSTTITFRLSQSSDVQVTIYNVMGENIRTLYSGRQNAGFVSLSWDATDSQGHVVPSGIYYYQVKAGSQIATRRMLLLR